MIFGSDGSVFRRSGDIMQGPGGQFRSVGNTTFLPDGESMRSTGGMTFLSTGDVIRKAGSGMWFGPKGSYRLSGGILFGPDGKTWRGVSESEVEMLISQDK